MKQVISIVFAISKRMPLGAILLFFLQRIKSKKHGNVSAEEARREITSLHKRPAGCSYWENKIVQEPGIDLSVVIPCYRAEKTIRRCVESVLTQKTAYSFELVLVNDGSPDGTGAVLDGYGNKDNIQVIHQQNSGAAVARNTGIRNARGKYVMFLDADDALYPDAIQVLMKTAIQEKADIAEGSYRMFYGEKEGKAVTHGYEVGEHGKNMLGYPWGKVIKTALFENYCFPADYWFEDSVIASLIFPKAKTTVTLPNFIVKYYQSSMGLTAQSGTDYRCLDIYYIMEDMIETAQKTGLDVSADFALRILRQMSIYIFPKTQFLSEKEMRCLFALVCDLAKRTGILAQLHTEKLTPWEEQAKQAILLQDYRRWQIASRMM